uniref:Uncharacterized protein n=1 Tax=Nelumbo nucifera TaxID=4432 RepID=A0A822YTT0_NELNU|nr:TPA_asm: hypothetical protein HUJ06_005591 [Nelumbo nucifera]
MTRFSKTQASIGSAKDLFLLNSQYWAGYLLQNPRELKMLTSHLTNGSFQRLYFHTHTKMMEPATVHLKLEDVGS